jgi:hypothetical protein
MKKLAATAVLASSLLLGACSHTGSSTAGQDGSITGAPAADQKSGETIKTGIVSEAGGSFFLQEAGDTPREVESYSVDFSEYVGQTVTVTGQYSGDTLFVGQIE